MGQTLQLGNIKRQNMDLEAKRSKSCHTLKTMNQEQAMNIKLAFF